MLQKLKSKQKTETGDKFVGIFWVDTDSGKIYSATDKDMLYESVFTEGVAFWSAHEIMRPLMHYKYPEFDVLKNLTIGYVLYNQECATVYCDKSLYLPWAQIFRRFNLTAPPRVIQI